MVVTADAAVRVVTADAARTVSTALHDKQPGVEIHHVRIISAASTISEI